jgi:hypothetical protein
MRGLITSIAATLAVALSTSAAADPVTDSMKLSERLYEDATRGGGGTLNRPRSALLEAHWSRLAAAMFEAANAADPRFESLLGLAPSGSAADGQAAVLAAAHGVLVHAFPDRKAELDQSLAFNLAQLPAGAARDEGVRLGTEAARLANARVVFAKGAKPWLEQPVPAFGAYVGTNEPMLGSWRWGYRPWLLKDLTSIKVGPFPAVGSESYTSSYEETRRIGAKDSKERTPAQTAAARFWANALNPVPTIRNVAASRRMPLVEVARLNALMMLSEMDVIYMVDLNKLGQARWRPTTAIRLGDQDGNDRTVGDPSWEPYLRTPTSGEFPCGHCTSGAAMGALFEAEPVPLASAGR